MLCLARPLHLTSFSQPPVCPLHLRHTNASHPSCDGVLAERGWMWSVPHPLNPSSTYAPH
eukprot:3742353-Rhodomonas_salina.3